MDKNETYQLLLAQVKAMVKDESDPVANMANVAALIQEAFHFWWTGFYRVIDNQLVLGPFQGPVACTRIGFGKGVCGISWKERKTLVVEDVEQFPGHIACSSESKSEIVVPLIKQGEVIGVLDIDSERLATFDATDQHWLEQIARWFPKFYNLRCSARIISSHNSYGMIVFMDFTTMFMICSWM